MVLYVHRNHKAYYGQGKGGDQVEMNSSSKPFNPQRPKTSSSTARTAMLRRWGPCQCEATCAASCCFNSCVEQPHKDSVQKATVEEQPSSKTIQKAAVEEQPGSKTIQKATAEEQPGSKTIQKATAEEQPSSKTIYPAIRAQLHLPARHLSWVLW